MLDRGSLAGFGACLLGVAGSAAWAAAQDAGGVADAGEPAGVSEGGGFSEAEAVTGDWWGLRPRLASGGVVVGGEYIAEYSGVLDGGVRESGSFRNLLTIDAEFDLETIAGLEGGRLFVQYLSVNAERGGSMDAGDIQVYSNIENDRSLDVIYEAWYEQFLFGERLRLKVGKVDANSEFGFVDVAGDFSNSSAGFSPSLFVLPSYPDPAMSLNLFATLIDGASSSLSVGYGFYDGAAAVDGVATGRRGPSSFFDDDLSDDYFHIGQLDLVWEGLGSGAFFRDGRASLGGWYHTGDFARFDGGVEDGTYGVFATAEMRLFDPARRGRVKPPGVKAGGPASGPDQGVYVFGQYGWADDSVSEIGQHIAGGLVLKGPLSSRPDDRCGIYGTLAVLSGDPAAGFDRDEFSLDVYYRFQLTPAVFVQPEAQYIWNPSGDGSIDDALVLGVRVGIVF